MFRFRALLGVLLLVLLLQEQSTRAVAAPEPFTIDVILSTTGPNSLTGSYSQEALKVFESYANRTGGIRGRPIQFAFADDQSNPQIAVQLLSAIAAKHPAVVLGSDAVAPCAAMLAFVTQGPVMYCTSPGLDAPRGSYAFAATSSVKTLLAGIVRYFRLRGFTKIALVMATDAMGQLSERYMQDAFALPENKSLHIVADERFNGSDLTFEAQVARVKSAAPEAIFAWATGPAFGTLLREFYNAGLNVPVATSGGNAYAVQLKQYGAFLPPQILFAGLPQDLTPEELGSSPIRRALDEYRGAFRAVGLTPSPAGSPYAWDVASIVLRAFRTLGTGATATQVRDYIESLHDFVGINGVYDFSIGDQHGLTGTSLVVTRWDPASGTFVAVSGLGGVPLRTP